MRAVDLFAGAGGFTAGAEIAGARVVWAANHWPEAVACHATNHPHVEHACQDLRQADFSRLPDFDLLLASPACQGHSEASQPRRRPKHDADRATAWAVIDCADTCRPRAIVVENVLSFRSRWDLYPVWRLALETLGYTLTELVLDAADFGVPQNRKRLFVVGLRKRRQIAVWPTVRRHVPARTFLERDGAWEPIRSKPMGVQARVHLGRDRNKLGRTFLLQQVSRGGRRALERPIGTITCARTHWHLVDGDMIRPLSIRELARAQGFEDTFALPESVTIGTRLVGNAVPPPLAAAVVRATMEAS
jgi:DNA (cytosine-5)-methyltransferase 1